MSSFINKAINKAENMLDSKSNKGDNPRSDNYGPHGFNVGNKVDPTVDSDLDNRNNPSSRVGGYGNTQANDSYGTTGGASGFASSDTYGSNTNNPGYDNPRSQNAGSHSSNLMNKVDPRVDSDRDGRNDPTSRAGGIGNTQTYGDSYGQAGGAGGLGTSDTGYGSNTRNTTYHDSTVRSSGLSGGNTGYGDNAGTYGSTTTGYGDNTGSYGSTNTGPHNSNLANKLDPRVDSDNDNRNNPTSRVGGYGTQDNYGSATGGYGDRTSGYGDTSRTTGVGGLDNRTTGYGDTGRTTGIGGLDNRDTSYRDNSGYQGSNTSGGYGDSSITPGSGTANKTAGPHNSDMLNKLDPRVDSDMDGSKTYGGNRTNY